MFSWLMSHIHLNDKGSMLVYLYTSLEVPWNMPVLIGHQYILNIPILFVQNKFVRHVRYLNYNLTYLFKFR